MSAPRAGATGLQTDLLRMPAPLTAAFVVPPGARLVFLSGFTAKDAESRTVAPGDAGAQADHILDAIHDVLRQAGGGLEDVIKLTIYLQGRDHAAAVGRVRALRFPDPPPASTMLISQLMSDDQLVEIEAVGALSA